MARQHLHGRVHALLAALLDTLDEFQLRCRVELDAHVLYAQPAWTLQVTLTSPQQPICCNTGCRWCVRMW